MRFFRIADRPNLYIYPWYIAELANTKDMWEIFGLGVNESFFTIERDYGTWHFDEESSDKLGKLLFDRVIKDEKFFGEVIEKIYSYSEILSAFSRELNKLKNVQDISNERLVQYYREYIEKLRILRAWGSVPVFIDGLKVNYLSDHALSELKKFLEAKGKASELNHYYSVLSAPDKPSDVQKETLARLKMLSAIEDMKGGKQVLNLIKNANTDQIENKYPEIYLLFKKHIGEFSWLTYAYSGPAMSLEDLYELMRDALKSTKSISEMLEKESSKYVEIKKQKAELIKGSDLPKTLQYVFNVLSELMYIKDYRKGIYQRSYVAMDVVMNELAKRLNISLKEIKYLSFEEVEDVLLDHNIARYLPLIKERLEKCCYVVVDGKITIYSGKDYGRLVQEKLGSLKGISIDNQKIIKGMIAYQGKVQGLARLILTKEDTKKLKEGEILVSSATNPDLVVAMKRAGGIVTDTGGIISHAAIVSRELKKPCVVGTQIGTKAIHDGDLVELDADKGIITILKKKHG